MANEKRLIDANELAEQVDNLCADWNENWIGNDNQSFILHSDVSDLISDAPTVDAIPLDDIKLHHILIDNEGVPEVKLQIGDRYFIMRTDPVDVREVVHGRWIPMSDNPLVNKVSCSVCGGISMRGNYCPNCGAKMDGDSNDST